MIGVLVRGRVRIKIRIRVRVGVTGNIRVHHWSNCCRSKFCTFEPAHVSVIEWLPTIKVSGTNPLNEPEA